ncbi:DUF4055 domain-containing protein [Endozoicomonas sp. GU-1]|uniref:DUF4055 domain-containing protein n=1 Tax=Endozoicomonas sp. GU-1 TaxID=3009078 RepID=UPI0022B548B1|nr:DUF4055 domain-containing protein [Endozoicomonas sp. GU-1]WBA79563.1 DUF4055 domain-containing protein [Endozoicomonas sp. GU-1]
MTQDVDYCRIHGDKLRQWQMIDDACEGEQAIKKAGARYLPTLNPQDISEENEARNRQYRERASYYNATGRTKSGLMGVAFSKDPSVELPAGLEYLIDNADGQGIGLEQVAQKTLSHVSTLGRAGLLVDYPLTSGSMSKAESAGKGATILRYHPRQVINWDTETVGGITRLSLVVLMEQSTVRNIGDFKHTDSIRYRVLELIDGVYQVRIFEQTDRGFEEVAGYLPTDASGKYWNEIPFTFVGAENNDADIDQAPLADLSYLNIAHYRNSADLEESSFIAGQPTLVVSGLTQQWYEQNLQGRVYIGARGGLPLPQNADAKLLQAAANSLPLELMKHKEEQMVKIGARLLMPGQNITATATNSSDKSAYSVLALCCANVSGAITKCLQWCALYMGVTGEARYEISRDFVTAQLTSQDLLALVQLWQSGTVAKSDIRALLRKHEIVDPERTDEEIDAELEVEPVPLSA